MNDLKFNIKGLKENLNISIKYDTSNEKYYISVNNITLGKYYSYSRAISEILNVDILYERYLHGKKKLEALEEYDNERQRENTTE